MDELAPAVREALASYRGRLEEHFGSRLRRLVLFGSAARGEARWDSDVDVLVVLDQTAWRDVAAAVDLAADELSERGVLLSATVLSEDHLADLGRRERRLALDIARDGVPL
jgi:predicted nucleotidyltransferase